MVHSISWRPLFGLAVRMGTLVVVAAAVAALANLVSPRRIAWVEDWGHYAEALAREQGIALLPLRQLQAQLAAGSVIVLDARPTSDYDAGHIAGAMSLPYDERDVYFGQLAPLFTPAQPLVTYCSGNACDDALLLAAFLRQQGLTNVWLFAGGWEEWIQIVTTNAPVGGKGP